jgi:FkbM family methyltransferase
MLDITRAYGLDFLFPARDRFVGASLRQMGEFARPEMDIIARLVGAAGPCAYLDIGANIGSIALPVAARNRQARVIAVEGNRHLATILSANTLNNRLGNVDVHHAVAGAGAGIMTFPTPPLDAAINFGALAVGTPGAQENVRVLTLDEIAPANTRVVKLDVEGFEREVLAGATALFARREASWIIEHKGDDKAHAITGQFLEAGYRCYWLFAPFTTPSAIKGAGDRKQTTGDTNILAMPTGEPPVPMAELHQADAMRPTGLDSYPYLRTYGF